MKREMTQDHSDGETHAMLLIDKSGLAHSNVVLQAAMRCLSITLGRAGFPFVRLAYAQA